MGNTTQKNENRKSLHYGVLVTSLCAIIVFLCGVIVYVYMQLPTTDAHVVSEDLATEQPVSNPESMDGDREESAVDVSTPESRNVILKELSNDASNQTESGDQSDLDESGGMSKEEKQAILKALQE